MKQEYQISESEFASHMESVFEPHHFVNGKFKLTNEALIHAMNVISFDCFETEIHLKEEAPYFTGKFTIQETLRKLQALASMLAIALEK